MENSKIDISVVVGCPKIQHWTIDQLCQRLLTIVSPVLYLNIAMFALWYNRLRQTLEHWACANTTLKNYSNKPTSAASVSLVSASDWSILGCLVTICQQREYAPVMKWTRIQVNIWHLYLHGYFTKIYAAVTMMEADTEADRVRGRTGFFSHTLW